MRAQFIRGEDPKKTMQIGLIQKWLSLEKGNILRIKKGFTTDSQHEITDKSRYNVFLENDYLIINTPPELYDDGAIGFTAYIGTKTVRSNDDHFIWGTPIQIEEVVERVPRIEESVNFERGQDPKDSMKIGRVGERDIKKTLERLVEIRGGRYEIKHLEDWVEGIYYMGPGYDKVFRSDNFFIRYYPVSKKTPQDHFTYGYRIQGKIMTEKILTTAEQGMTEILKHITPLPHHSNESINFERGLDPKKAMKIGKDFLPYKKGDKVKVWVPWEKRLVEVKVYEDEELDSDGKTKIKKMISNSKPSWEVRRIWVRYNGEVRTANLAIHPETPEQDKWIIHQ